MHNIKLIIAYDGYCYLGWQKTAMGPSIEATLQRVLEQILQHPVSLQAASRTDAGVHAQGQVVNFFTSKPDLDYQRLLISLNQLLPKDIVVLDVAPMPPSFHPTLHCTSKEYRYYISEGITQLPQYRLYAWHCHTTLEKNHMQKATQYLIGRHDFSAFCNAKNNEEYEHHMREITDLKLETLHDQRLCIIVKGPQFLYKMVRNLVGTLVDIGKGKLQADEIPDILQSQTRTQAGVTAPAHGLFLHQVNY